VIWIMYMKDDGYNTLMIGGVDLEHSDEIWEQIEAYERYLA
jgi:hypothetical protein